MLLKKNFLHVVLGFLVGFETMETYEKVECSSGLKF